MQARIIYTKMWKDEFFAELSPTEKLLFIYLITNDKVNIIHCYELSDREIAFDTGVDKVTIQKAKEKFQANGKMAFKENYIYLVNGEKYQNFRGSKNEEAKEKIFKLMSKDVLDWYNNILDRGIDKGIDTNRYPPIINNQYTVINKHIGVVKGMEIINPGELQELQDKYPLLNVLEEFESAKDWLASTGKVKSDYKAFFRNWLRRAKPTTKKKGMIEI